MVPHSGLPKRASRRSPRMRLSKRRRARFVGSRRSTSSSARSDPERRAPARRHLRNVRPSDADGRECGQAFFSVRAGLNFVPRLLQCPRDEAPHLRIVVGYQDQPFGQTASPRFISRYPIERDRIGVLRSAHCGSESRTLRTAPRRAFCEYGFSRRCIPPSRTL